MAATSTLRELWDTTRMRLLVEIERQGSVSAAAAAIGIGQPSASQHLRLLESAAGQRLVERTGRGSRLTDAGHVLASRAAQALASLGAAEEELDAIAGLQTGTIHLGASTAPGVYLLPDTLGCFRRSYPGVTVEVEVAASDAILRRLLAGRVQLALVGATRADERIQLDPFLEDEIVGVAKPGLAPLKKGALAPTRLAEFMLLARESGSSSQPIVDEELRAIGIKPAGIWELGSSEAIKRAKASDSADGRHCCATSRSPDSRAVRSRRPNEASSKRSRAAAETSGLRGRLRRRGSKTQGSRGDRLDV